MLGIEQRRFESGDQIPGKGLQNLLVSGIRLPAIVDEVAITLDSVTDSWRPVWTTRGETR
jgi:hypothetical protein